MFYFLSIGPNVDIYPSKRLWKLSVTKIGQVFTSQFYPLRINHSLSFLYIIMGRIKCSLCLKKKQAKKLTFAPKIALRVERSDPTRNPYFPDFLSARLQCSQLLWNCAKIKAVYWRARGERRQDTAQTSGLNCGVTHCPGKIEYTVIVATLSCLSARKYTKKNSVKWFSYSTGYCPLSIDQCLKFKNHCSLLTMAISLSDPQKFQW